MEVCYIFGKNKFLVDSQILNWTYKACFREELPRVSLGSFAKVSLLPTSEVCGRKYASLCQSHNFFIVKFYTSCT